MNKKVLVISRVGCQLCQVLEYELYFKEKIDAEYFNNEDHSKIFHEFINYFNIHRFPVIQVDNGKEFITIHGDPNFVESTSGAGSKTSRTLFYFEDTVNKQISRLKELLKD